MVFSHPAKSQENLPASLQVCSLQPHAHVHQSPTSASSTHLSVCLSPHPDQMGARLIQVSWTENRVGAMWGLNSWSQVGAGERVGW